LPQRPKHCFCRMRSTVIGAILLSLSTGFAVMASAAAPPKVYEARAAGASGAGKTLDTAAIQHALDDCGKAGGGIVRFSAGVYLSKPIFLRSKTTLELGEGATLKATDEEADFADPAKPGAWRAFVGFVNGRQLEDITITGPGTIDGSGARWWGPAREAKRTNTLNPGYTLPRPKLIVLNKCRNVRVTQVTLMNSPCFHLVPSDCENVVIDGVTITAPADSPNTDAIDPSASRHVLISHCRLDVRDDNVAIKAGRSSSVSPPTCEDIMITDCTFLHGHGMSIGSESAGGVRNVTVRRCTFQDTENGLRIKSPRGKGGIVENINYSDITMKNVDPAILFTCYYPKIPKVDPGEAVNTTTPIFRNIHVSNLTATCPRSAGIIVGLPESPVSDVVFENVHITATEGLSIRNAHGVQLKQVQVDAKHGPAFMVEKAQVEGLPEGIK
jgi:polygalacturonase